MGKSFSNGHGMDYGTGPSMNSRPSASSQWRLFQARQITQVTFWEVMADG